jgi:hypothetical protein
VRSSGALEAIACATVPDCPVEEDVEALDERSDSSTARRSQWSRGCQRAPPDAVECVVDGTALPGICPRSSVPGCPIPAKARSGPIANREHPPAGVTLTKTAVADARSATAPGVRHPPCIQSRASVASIATTTSRLALLADYANDVSLVKRSAGGRLPLPLRAAVAARQGRK